MPISVIIFIKWGGPQTKSTRTDMQGSSQKEQGEVRKNVKVAKESKVS